MTISEKDFIAILNSDEWILPKNHHSKKVALALESPRFEKFIEGYRNRTYRLEPMMKRAWSILEKSEGYSEDWTITDVSKLDPWDFYSIWYWNGQYNDSYFAHVII